MEGMMLSLNGGQDAADVSGGEHGGGGSAAMNGNWGFLPSSTTSAAARARHPPTGSAAGGGGAGGGAVVAPGQPDPWWVHRRQTLSQLSSGADRRRCTPPSGNLGLGGTEVSLNASINAAPTPAGAAAKAVAAAKGAAMHDAGSLQALQGGGRLHSLSMRGRMPGR